MLKIIEKKLGETPLQATKRYTKEKATYAGRLDPMATGKLLILTGKDLQRREEFLHLDKEYEVEILLDISTDTGDILGLPSLSLQQTHLSNNIIQKALKHELGTHTREYPHFSSKPVNGKPLFTYALENTLDTIEIPTHKETIYAIELLHTRVLSRKNLLGRIQKSLSNVPRSSLPSKALGADFRQDEIRERWNTLIPQTCRGFQVIKIRVIAGSGAYMRTLAARIGGTFGTGALALSIHRSKIGKIKKLLNIHFWTKVH